VAERRCWHRAADAIRGGIAFACGRCRGASTRPTGGDDDPTLIDETASRPREQPRWTVSPTGAVFNRAALESLRPRGRNRSSGCNLARFGSTTSAVRIDTALRNLLQEATSRVRIVPHQRPGGGPPWGGPPWGGPPWGGPFSAVPTAPSWVQRSVNTTLPSGVYPLARQPGLDGGGSGGGSEYAVAGAGPPP
jgi:hypothetical protein